MHHSGRCPRCGYVMRLDGLWYRCDFCGNSRLRGTLKDMLQDLERTLRFRIFRVVESLDRTRPQQTVTYQPTGMQQQFCFSCGLNIPVGSRYCTHCGATQSIDQTVLDYIISRNGTISLSQASQDLAMSPDALRFTIERLKAAGLLQPT
jgi:hypothetical protein